MEIKINLYETIYNGGLGTCHLLQKKKGGCMSFKEVYLFYSEDYSQHFIVCEGVSGQNDNCYFHYARYYTALENAIEEYRKIK